VRQQQKQDKDWNEPMGYFDYITDARNPEYTRGYVGQCVNAQRRLISQHAQEILRGSTRSLHYFIAWMGNGMRSVNFIRLWAFPETSPTTEEKIWTDIQMNLLEALFCKAFGTHHGVLDPSDSHSVERKSYGLNLMTPLAQNRVMQDFRRTQYVDQALNSPDPQIIHWLQVIRPKRIAADREQEKHWLGACRPVFRRDFDNALRTGLGGNDNLFRSVKDSMSSPMPERHQNSPIDVSTPYFGTLKAKVAFVLDYAAVSLANDSFGEHAEELPRVDLPWAYKAASSTKQMSFFGHSTSGHFRRLI
jgi:hypothetical protein